MGGLREIGDLSSLSSIPKSRDLSFERESVEDPSLWGHPRL